MATNQANLTAARRPVWLLTRGIIALSLLVPALLLGASPVAADHSLATTTTCNNYAATGGGTGVICEVTIANTITASGGSSTVTVHECLGSAGAPLLGSCSTTTQVLTLPVSTVNQCNNTAYGGGSTVRCSVDIVNDFVGVSPGATAVTVDQCVGSGDGATGGCSPLQSTTSAAVTQCNGSAYGGTLVELTCTVTGTISAAFPMTVTQCNDSAYGGGGLLICSTSMVNEVAPATTAAPSITTASSASAAKTVPATSTTGNASAPGSMPLLPLMILLGLSGLALATVVTQRRSLHS